MGEEIKREILKVIEKLFSEYEKSGLSYERIQWELDYLVYPHIGSFLSSGELSREEGKEIFEYCERKLKRIKEKQKERRS